MVVGIVFRNYTTRRCTTSINTCTSMLCRFLQDDKARARGGRREGSSVDFGVFDVMPSQGLQLHVHPPRRRHGDGMY